MTGYVKEGKIRRVLNQREKVTEGCRKLHIEGLHNLYSPLNITSLIN
jgi:hypothetical protein